MGVPSRLGVGQSRCKPSHWSQSGCREIIERAKASPTPAANHRLAALQRKCVCHMGNKGLAGMKSERFV